MISTSGEGWGLGIALLTIVFLLCCILWLRYWRDKTADGQPHPMRGQPIEAELMDAPPSASSSASQSLADRRCRACVASASLGGWRRPSTISVMAGFVGWSRRVRGLPPLYTRTRPAFGAEDLCAECSHVRDSKIDKKIMELNLMVHSVGEGIAMEVQRFMVSIDDELKDAVAPADYRARRLKASNAPEVRRS